MIDCITHTYLAPVSHGFFHRTGGVSTGIYDSLNTGLGSGDFMHNILHNRELVRQYLGADFLCGVRQAHTNKVAILTQQWDTDTMPIADSIVTNISGIGIGVLTADCVPVLLYDSVHGIIGATHAGWRGAIDGVLHNTVESMVSIGGKVESIVAVIGPHIQQESYEVGTAFYQNFVKRNASNIRYFKVLQESYLFDLNGYVYDILASLNIGKIASVGLDTYSNPTKFFSYRRSTHEGIADYGRQISAIVLP